MIKLTHYDKTKIRTHESKKEDNDQDWYNQAPHLTKDTNGKVTT